MKPSEYLESKGWEKVHPSRPAHLSDWRDPINRQRDYLFAEAVIIQAERDIKEEQERKLKP